LLELVLAPALVLGQAQALDLESVQEQGLGWGPGLVPALDQEQVPVSDQARQVSVRALVLEQVSVRERLVSVQVLVLERALAPVSVQERALALVLVQERALAPVLAQERGQE
jgi:hypothetical protein